MEQLAICAGQIYPTCDVGGSEARGVDCGLDSNLPFLPNSPAGGSASEKSSVSGGASMEHLSGSNKLKYTAYSGEEKSRSGSGSWPGVLPLSHVWWLTYR